MYCVLIMYFSHFIFSSHFSTVAIHYVRLTFHIDYSSIHDLPFNTGHQLLTTHDSVFIVYYLLFSIDSSPCTMYSLRCHHSLFVIKYFELTIQYSLLDIYYLRFTLHHVPCTPCDVISSSCHLLFSIAFEYSLLAIYY